MTYLSLFSGIEAASVAWNPIGWTCAGVAEIEPFPAALLAGHYPSVPNLGDVTAPDFIDRAAVLKPDVLVGGSPCQAFSIAGNRGSLDDSRGNLTLRYVEIANGINPGIIVWENVPGVLSTADNAFGCFLGALVGSDSPLVPGRGQRWTRAGVVDGPRRSAAWRVFDAQYFGLAQRRERVFVVASLRDWPHPAEILFEREGVQRHFAPRREAGESVTGTLAARASAGGGLGTDFDCAGGLVHSQERVAPARVFNESGHGWWNEDEFAATVRDASGGGGSHSTLIPSQPISHCASVSPTSNCLNAGGMGRIVPTLRANGDAHSGFRDECGIIPAYSLAFQERGREGGRNLEMQSDLAYSLNSPGAGGRSQERNILSGMAVRRLTPKECERLQGFPDIRKTITINVCFGLQNRSANAATKSLRSQVSACNAEEERLQENVSAEEISHSSHPSHGLPVAAHVLIDLERGSLEVRSAGRSQSLVLSADDAGSFHLPMGVESFVHLSALIVRTLESKITAGRGESPVPTRRFTHLWSGSDVVTLSGEEIPELAENADSVISTAINLSRSTTSAVGLNSQTSGLTIQTLCCCAVRAISLFIPDLIQGTNSFSVKLTTSEGYTATTHRGKPAADGPRYKALGNSMAVTCMAWIGRQIQRAVNLRVERAA
jgi:DNA (cytosine-5)-methyltransferase 1